MPLVYNPETGELEETTFDAIDTANYDFGYGNNETSPVIDTGGNNYDFWKDIGIDPSTLSDFSNSPSNDEIEAGMTGESVTAVKLRNLATQLGKDGFNKLKGLFTKDGKTDWTRLLAMAGGAYAASRPSSTTPTGYQGRIPKLSATRNMLTAPPVGRRPGSGGIDYGGGVTFRNPAGEVVQSNERTLEELRQAAVNNPFNRGATFEGQQSLGQSDLASLLQLLNPPGAPSATGGGSAPALGGGGNAPTTNTPFVTGPAVPGTPPPSDMQRDFNSYWSDVKVGTHTDFAGGVLYKYSPTQAVFMTPDRREYTLTNKTDMNAIAYTIPEIANEWKKQYGFTPTGTPPPSGIMSSDNWNPIRKVYADADRDPYATDLEMAFDKQLRSINLSDYRNNRNGAFEKLALDVYGGKGMTMNDIARLQDAVGAVGKYIPDEQNPGTYKLRYLDDMSKSPFAPKNVPLQGYSDAQMLSMQTGTGAPNAALNSPFTTGLGSSTPIQTGPLNSMNLPVAGPSQADRDAAFAQQNAEFEARKARRAAAAAKGGEPTFELSGGVWGQPTGLAAGGLTPDGFVLPADVVSHFGNGSSEAGLKLLAAKLGAEPIKGEGDGMSDSIPTTIGGKQEARVANDEAFIPPEMVKRIGDGDAKKGAKKLYAMMDKIREERTGTKEQGKQIDPNKFMPGGSVQKYQTGGTTATRTLPATATGSESSLSNWAGDYVTNMLGQGAALANAPYQAYTGPLTAGASQLQTQGFTQAGNLQAPSSIGQAAGTAGGIANLAANMRYTPQTTSFLGQPNVSGLGMTPPAVGDTQGRTIQSSEPFAVDGGMTGGVMRPPKPNYSTMPVPEGGLMARGAQQGSDITQQYMNPYLESALRPQMAEMQRAADIARLADASRLTQAGAFGGSRQAIMESEARRNLLEKQSQALGQGYATAYDKAMQQFNADQDRRAKEAQFGASFGLEGLRTGLQGAQTQAQAGAQQSQSDIAGLRALLDAGAVERGIESEGIAADKAQFEEARMNPFKMLQFQQSLLSGMPLASQSYSIPGQSGLQQFAGGATTVQQLLDILSGKKAATTKP